MLLNQEVMLNEDQSMLDMKPFLGLYYIINNLIKKIN